MVDPSFFPQLRHDGVNPRVARLAVSPLGQRFRVLVPRDLHADRVARHLVEVGILRCAAVEELAPQKLPVKAQRRTSLLDLLVQVGQVVVEEAGGETAEAEVRREARLAGEQRLRRHFRSAEACDPSFTLQVTFEAGWKFEKLSKKSNADAEASYPTLPFHRQPRPPALSPPCRNPTRPTSARRTSRRGPRGSAFGSSQSCLL